VPVAYLAARELWDERAGLFAAALVAVNPYLVWYSQEARSYALLVLLSTLSVWLWARALSDPTGRRVATWAAVGVLALATHYFAAFLLVPEAAYLLFRLRSRAAALGIGAIALAGAALAPLALHQRASGSTTFIKDIALGSRVTSLPKKFVTGELGTPTAAIGALAALAVVAGVVALLVRGDARERRGGALVLGLAALTVLIPLVLAALGFDYLLPRNVLPAYALVALVAGAGMAVAGRAGLALAVLVAAVAVFVDVQVTRDTTLQRDDWRGAAEVLGPPPPSGARAVVVTSAPQRKALEHYAGAMRPLPPGGAAVAEIDVIGNARPPRYATPPLPPGFALFQHRRSDSWELYRYRATAPATVAPAALAQSRLGTKDAAILVQTTGSEGGRR
jgi:4-amino-4-deoxy-L-arabinose transferase-like glycosyltransferase